MNKNSILNVKKNGQVFTPLAIVKLILNKVGYSGKKILTKKIIDNSCGTGNFLIEIIERFCNEFLKMNQDLIKLKKQLEKYIFGIEIDPNLWKICKQKVDLKAAEYNVTNVNWQIFCENTIECNKFNQKMDYVVGNPPYVRVRNLSKHNTIKKFPFCKSSNTDLYLAFFNIGLNMLKKTGKLGYIAPNSYLKSIAGKHLRKHILDNRLIIYLKDFGWAKIFNQYATYSTVLILRNQNLNTKRFKYENFQNQIKNIKFTDYDQDAKKELIFDDEIKTILNSNPHQKVIVKNGFATLNDKIFFNQEKKWFGFNKYLIRTFKASTGKKFWTFFPYKKNNAQALSWEEIKKMDKLKQFLLKHKLKLDKKTKDSKWYLFGRNQAVKDVYKPKFAINNIIRNKSDIKLEFLEYGEGIYSGYYITWNDSVDKKIIEKIIKNDRFVNFVKKLGFYKQNGFLFFRSKDLEKFINYELQNQQ